MTRRHWRELAPGAVVGAGIVASTFIAVRTAASGRWVLAGPLLLASAVVCADFLNSRVRRKGSAPSWPGWLLGGSVFLAGLIVARHDAGLVKTLLPVDGAAAWAALLVGGGRGRELISTVGCHPEERSAPTAQ